MAHSFADEPYDIKQMYDYQLEGIVMSYRVHGGDQGLHKLWQDHFNVIDLCVAWGATAQSPFLNDIHVWRGRFTCFVEPKTQAADQSIQNNEFSNNHLISTNDHMRDRIRAVDIGDRFLLKGTPVHYRNLKNGAFRGTSTTRDDLGGGAFETIHVRDFEILDHHLSHFVYLALLAGLILILKCGCYFSLPRAGRALTPDELRLIQDARSGDNPPG